MKVKQKLVALLLGILLLSALVACTPEKSERTMALGTFEKNGYGIVVSPANGPAKKVRLKVMSDDIIRVTSSALETFNEPASIMVVAKPETVEFQVEAQGSQVILRTANIRAEVSLKNGTVHFLDKNGKTLLAESNASFGPVTEDPATPDTDSYAIRQTFLRGDNEAYYGLGQQQNGQVNLAGENVYMTTYNLVITIPYLVSSNHYAILWDNNSDSRYGSPNKPTDIGVDLTLFNADGKEGGITARYYDGDVLKLTRIETALNFQFLSQGSDREYPFPEEVKNAKNLRIEWDGSIVSNTEGEHEFLMYSSGYAKLALDGEVILDRWRMNWNPWYHNFKHRLNKGEKKKLHINWKPDGGYFRLLHQKPLPESEANLMSFASDSAKAIDYYFVAGANQDELVSGYRHLTGKSVMLPRWAYGFWQSRERYKSQDELLGALKEYRERKIPIDNIVLDWSYWPSDAWGSHDFDTDFFPNPKAMVDEVHDLNAQIMISVWPKFYPTTENYKELNAKGYVLNRNIEDKNLDWIAPGYLNAFYDAFNPRARKMFWRQMDEKINVHGFDAWWLDAVEPDIHSNASWAKRKEFMTPNYLGNGAEVFNAYAVPHAESVYQGDRESTPNTRVFILTRSGFGGIQRAASAIWSGDTVSRWGNLKEQIAAGIGTAMAGVPNWTFDIGGFTPEDRFRWNDGKFVGSYLDMDPAQLSEWQELNARWYQFGAFVPLYRSHGQNPYREIYNIAAEGSEVYESLVWYTRLRYRLMPYVYSQAGDMYHKDGTLMRGLAMDFPSDVIAGNLNDQYMFGPAFLVSPVYQMGATDRTVYLPEGSAWVDFYTGKRYQGGQSITAMAPLSRMPLFVRVGSIIPTGPEIQYADQSLNADLTLNIYTGANGSFELYEDDGRSYGYEKGGWSRIPLSYNHTTDELTIDSRIGSFNGMAEERRIHIRWIDSETADATNFDKAISTSVNYTGKKVIIKK